MRLLFLLLSFLVVGFSQPLAVELVTSGDFKQELTTGWQQT